MVGWVGVVGNGGCGVVGSGLFGCFCYGFAGFLVGFFFFFGSSGFGEQRVVVGMVVAWRVVGCLVIFAIGLLGLC